MSQTTRRVENFITRQPGHAGLLNYFSPSEFRLEMDQTPYSNRCGGRLVEEATKEFNSVSTCTPWIHAYIMTATATRRLRHGQHQVCIHGRYPWLLHSFFNYDQVHPYIYLAAASSSLFIFTRKRLSRITFSCVQREKKREIPGGAASAAGKSSSSSPYSNVQVKHEPGAGAIVAAEQDSRVDITVKLDMSVLHCPICFRPFKPPIFRVPTYLPRHLLPWIH